MTRLHLSAALSACLLFCACASKPQPFEDDWTERHKHSFDFMWEECIAALEAQYPIAEADRDTNTITTDWNENLAVMAQQGYRTRLVIVLEGDVENGYIVKGKEERELNTEQVNPTSSEEAEWEPASADGGSLARFRVALHRRLHPKEAWREAELR